jgi:hypothetical protein
LRDRAIQGFRRRLHRLLLKLLSFLLLSLVEVEGEVSPREGPFPVSKDLIPLVSSGVMKGKRMTEVESVRPVFQDSKDSIPPEVESK